MKTPEYLWLVRHGESVANVVRTTALDTDLHEVALTHRDVDVPLSARGEQQARALGRWFASRPAHERPTVVVASPYLRAARTAQLIGESGGAPAATTFDERVREKELGLFYRLTRRGIEHRYP